MKLRICTWLLIGSCSFLFGFSTAVSDVDCRFFLTTFFKKNNSLELGTNDKPVRLKYETSITYKSSLATEPINAITEVFIRKDFFFLKSSSISIYKDSVDYFFVSHANHSIARSVPNKAFSIEKFWSITNALQDSFINKAKLVQCTVEEDAFRDTIVNITVKQQAKFARATHIESASFKIRSKDLFMKESVINYMPESNVAIVKNSFANVDYDTQFQFPEHIKEMILNEKGQLRTEFKGYNLVDMRNRKVNVE